MKAVKRLGIIIGVILLLIGGCVAKIVIDLNSDGYSYVGGWEDTPLEAVNTEHEALSVVNSSYKVVQLLDTYYFEDEAFLLYVSGNDTLVRATCVKNDKSQWHFHSSSEEDDLNYPSSFVLDGTEDQPIFNPYSYYAEEKKVVGWKLSTAPAVKVNGKPAQTKTYTFKLGGKQWSVDYFYADGVDVKSEDEVLVEYVTE